MTHHSEQIKREVYALWKAGAFLPDLAKEYGIPERTIYGFIPQVERLIARKEKHEQAKKALSSGGVSFVPKVEEYPKHYESFRIGVIPDCQVKPNVDISHLPKIGRYFADKRPNVIVCIGDFADMPSLSSHESIGSLRRENQRYQLDIESVQVAMEALMTPIRAEMAKGWNPRLVMTMGNHEHRINRAIEEYPNLQGTIQIDDLRYKEWGWEVHDFLKPVVIEGIAFCHYFQTGQMGRPASSARAILNKQHMSCFAGHQQGRDIAYGKRGDGREMTAIICGSCYLHDEDYLSPQTNNHFRGIYMLNDVIDGAFEEMPISLRYLMRR